MLFKEYNKLFIFFKKGYFFLQHLMIESLRLEKENIINDKRNLVRLTKELIHTLIKYIMTRTITELQQLKIEYSEIIGI